MSIQKDISISLYLSIYAYDKFTLLISKSSLHKNSSLDLTKKKKERKEINDLSSYNSNNSL